MATVSQLKRPLSKWAAIGSMTAASSCILFWLVSLSTAKADFGFMFRVEDEITAARGTITISTILSSRDAQVARMNLAKPHRWKGPGFEIEHLEDYGGRTWLTVKFSALIPGLAAAFLAVFFVRRYNRCQKASATVAGPGVASAPKTDSFWRIGWLDWTRRR